MKCIMSGRRSEAEQTETVYSHKITEVKKKKKVNVVGIYISLHAQFNR